MTGTAGGNGATSFPRDVSDGNRGTRVRRRRLLGALGTIGVGAVAGCSGDGGAAGADADVVAGPEGRLVFEPETITVPAGDAVTWLFDSAGHNVCGRPADSEEVVLPPGADPYATYGPDQSPFTLVPAGETYEHRFPVPGTYVYSCLPHESAGMVGRVEVQA